MLYTPIRRLRTVGLLEGLSYLILLGVAMPLKYIGGDERAVQVVGAMHGGLFILFLLCMLEVTVRRPWWSPRFWAIAFVASLLPFGTFVLDRWLKQVEDADAVAPVGGEAVAD